MFKSNDKPMGKNWMYSPKVSLEESLDNMKPIADGNLSIPVLNKPEKSNKK
jgi:hypothetical protein